MNGKAIKMPTGAAAEYAKYACNFYKGCSNSCTYCFNRRWGWGNVPTLKKCFKDETHALEVFKMELNENLPELQKHGIFFSFSTDPMLPETLILTYRALVETCWNRVPVKILTKMSRPFLCNGFFECVPPIAKYYVSVGFTLTGHDGLDPNASPNVERIQAMRRLHEAGFKTWASIEPVIDIESSMKMIEQTSDFCDLYKIGLLSRKKYDKDELNFFVRNLVYDFTADCEMGNYPINYEQKFYFKDSLLQQAGINRADLPSNCVDRDYNIFEVIK